MNGGEMDDQAQGLYQKYQITRVDGSTAPGGKHAHCPFFVLDPYHDPHAIAALDAYALACEAEYPALARDLRALAQRGVQEQARTQHLADHWRSIQPILDRVERA